MSEGDSGAQEVAKMEVRGNLTSQVYLQLNLDPRKLVLVILITISIFVTSCVP